MAIQTLFPNTFVGSQFAPTAPHNEVNPFLTPPPWQPLPVLGGLVAVGFRPVSSRSESRLRSRLHGLARGGEAMLVP